MVEFRSKLDSSKSKALNVKKFKQLLWFYILLSLLLVFIGIMAITQREDNSDLIGGIIYIVLGVLLTPFGYFLTRIFQKSLDKSLILISEETEEVYTFDEQYITLTQVKGDVYSCAIKAKYSYIYKAIEDKNYYYLLISKMQSHVIDKSSITQGTLEEMTMLLKTNLGEKYKCK